MTERAERFTALFRRHHADVLAYALRRADESWADDVAAETFTAAWRHLDHLPQDPLPWLYRTARNCLANKERSARRQARLAGRLAGRAARVTPDHAAGIVEGARLRSALHELAVTDREALLLVSWEGLDQATAAYVLGCSVTAFKVRLHRARRRLLGLLAATDDAAAHDPANVEAALDPRPEGPR